MRALVVGMTCQNGHLLAAEQDIYTRTNGLRECAICQKHRQHLYAQRKREARRKERQKRYNAERHLREVADGKRRRAVDPMKPRGKPEPQLTPGQINAILDRQAWSETAMPWEKHPEPWDCVNIVDKRIPAQ